MYVVGYYIKSVAIPNTLVNHLDIHTRECAATSVNLIRHRVVQRPILQPEVALTTYEHRQCKTYLISTTWRADSSRDRKITMEMSTDQKTT